MILFSFANTGPIPGFDDRLRTNILGRRWALEVTPTSISFTHQYRTESGWLYGVGYYDVGVLHPKRFRLGYSEVEYNGIHHTLWLGVFYASWLT